VKTVPCPRCGASAPYAPENRWRPFCSERCKTVDLGAWAAEEYRVAGAPLEPGTPLEPQDTGPDAK